MNKKKGLILFSFFDLFVLFGLWLAYDEINQVFTGIANSVDAVSFNNRIGFFIVGIGLPLVHFFGIIIFFWPKLLAKRTSLVNRLLIVLGAVLLASGFFISAYMQTYVERAGYQYCRGASGVSALSKTIVYTKDPEVCSRLTDEKIKKMHLSPK